jgi:hypothetical protein
MIPSEMAKPRKPELAPHGVYVGLYAAKLEFESKFAIANPSSGEQPRLTRWQRVLPWSERNARAATSPTNSH